MADTKADVDAAQNAVDTAQKIVDGNNQTLMRKKHLMMLKQTNKQLATQLTTQQLIKPLQKKQIVIVKRLLMMQKLM